MTDRALIFRLLLDLAGRAFWEDSNRHLGWKCMYYAYRVAGMD